jgi:hypothetical protein
MLSFNKYSLLGTDAKALETDNSDGLHNTVNILNGTELYPENKMVNLMLYIFYTMISLWYLGV